MVAVTDNHYMLMLGGLIKSIEHHLDDRTLIDLWVVDDGLTTANREKLQQSVNQDITTLHWKEVRSILPKTMKLPIDFSSWPLNIYIRLFVPDFLPPDVRKVLFMDVDIINCRNIRDLWKTDLGEHIVGAVRDPNVQTFDNSWGGIFNYRDLGFDGGTKYFNSGVLLIDLDKWRAHEITRKTLDYIRRYRKYAKYPDQYGLNISLANKWHELDAGWNHFAVHGEGVPFNIHFTERKPIYKTYRNSLLFKEQFYHYLALTAWKDFRPIGEGARYIKKIWNVVEKMSLLHLWYLLTD